MHRIDWDDLRYVLAVAEHGSLAAGARALGVNHTTVLRRINAFESAQAVRLFERLPTGYALTAGGEELLAAARQMGDVVTALERRLAGQDLRLEGNLRATTIDTLMVSVLPTILAAFRAAHPGVQIEISVSNTIANLTRRDADAAIRRTEDPPETLVGRRVAGVAFALYAARDSEFPEGMPLDELPWVAPDDPGSSPCCAPTRWCRCARPPRPGSVSPRCPATSATPMPGWSACGPIRFRPGSRSGSSPTPTCVALPASAPSRISSSTPYPGNAISSRGAGRSREVSGWVADRRLTCESV
jgi:DNA-binding transcriptional LysR family regulator